MTVFVGFTGLPGAGKGALIDRVDPACRSRNLTTRQISLSDELREMVAARGLKVERPILNEVANELRKQLGNSAMAQVAFKRLLTNDSDTESADVVFIDAIRTPEEVDWFRDVLPSKSFTMVSVVADSNIIVARIQQRARGDENEEVVKSPQKAMELLESEAGKSQPKFGLNIAGAVENSDLTFDNSGDASALENFSEVLIDAISEMVSNDAINERDHLSGYLFLVSSREQRLNIASGYSESKLNIPASKLRILLNFETDIEVRWHLLKTIGAAKHNELADTLVAEGRRGNHDFGNTSLHHIAAWSLGKLGADVMPLVTSAIANCEGGDEITFLTDALGELALPEGIDHLVLAFNEGTYETRLTASLSMSKLGGVSVEPLAALLQSEDSPDSRVLLIDALIKIGTEMSVSSARSLAREDESKIIDKLMNQNNIS